MLFKRAKRLDVVIAGASVLKGVAAPVEAITPEIRELCDNMLCTMRYFDGIGLAAPQVGVALRLVVLEVPDANSTHSEGEELLLPQMPFAMVNPVIVERSTTLAEREEGCLSVPDIFAKVVRPAEIVVEFTSLNNDKIRVRCGGLLGRCIQHETDHLDGLLFTDRLAPPEMAGVMNDLNQLIAFGEKNNFKRKRK